MSEKLQIIAVKFYDTVHYGDWTDEPEEIHADTCFAIGFLRYEDDRWTVLAQVANERGSSAGICVIPAGCILERTEVNLN